MFYFDYLECDSKSSSQWLKTSLVVGGLTLADPTGDFSQHKITWNDRFPDPKEILYQPLNPRAGVKWSDNMSYNYTNSGMNVAYTKARQTTTAINARANAWKAIKSKLAAMSTDLAAGKQVCMKSGKVSLCYRLGMQTGYVAKKVPAGSKTQHQLTDGTPIITDDVSDALENKLANIAPMKEPKWFICSTKKIIDQWHSQIMHLPGVVANQYCISSEGSKQYNGYWRAPEINVITDGTDVFWQPAGNGYLPSSAVITGRIKLNTATGAFDATNQKTGQLTGSTVAMFSCRAMVGRKTKIGWTIGGKYCHILKFAGGAVVENFEVLTVNGSIAAPPPPPSPAASCTYQMVHNYYYGIQPSCTADQYNKEHPDCHFMSRHNGSCDGGPPPDDN